MVRPEAESGAASAPRRPSSSVRGTEALPSAASRTAKVPIVRPAIRLPRDLYEKMPSAPTTPTATRRAEHGVSKLADSSPSTKKVPKSVASMVRR